jgi:hypothetical protein
LIQPGGWRPHDEALLPRTIDVITQYVADLLAVQKKDHLKTDLGCAFTGGFPLN